LFEDASPTWISKSQRKTWRFIRIKVAMKKPQNLSFKDWATLPYLVWRWFFEENTVCNWDCVAMSITTNHMDSLSIYQTFLFTSFKLLWLVTIFFPQIIHIAKRLPKWTHERLFSKIALFTIYDGKVEFKEVLIFFLGKEEGKKRK